jgi:hypothetical protein
MEHGRGNLILSVRTVFSNGGGWWSYLFICLVVNLRRLQIQNDARGRLVCSSTSSRRSAPDRILIRFEQRHCGNKRDHGNVF